MLREAFVATGESRSSPTVEVELTSSRRSPRSILREAFVFRTGSFISFPEGTKGGGGGSGEANLIESVLPGTQLVTPRLDEATWSRVAALRKP